MNSVVTRLDTIDGVVVMDEFDDDGHTIPIQMPPDITPAMLKLLNDLQHSVIERIASDFERMAGGRAVQMSTHKAAARVRSMVAMGRRAA